MRDERPSFRRRDQYVFRREDCLAGLEFVDTIREKSANHAGFTLRLWVLSNRLNEVFGPPSGIGEADNFHWFRGANYISETKSLGPGSWIVQASDPVSLDRAVADVRLAIVELEARASDEGLIRDWMSERDPWLSEARQAAYVAVLLQSIGREEESWELATLARVIAEHGDREAKDLAVRLDQARIPGRSEGDWPQLFSVTFTSVEGQEAAYTALTILGPNKAIAMATAQHVRQDGWPVLNVVVQGLGPAPRAEDGTLGVGPPACWRIAPSSDGPP